MRNTATDVDVCVIGAGPAGSASSFVLARAGAKVLVLERAAFPRPKLCAGICPWKTQQLLERLYGYDPETLLARGVFTARSDACAIRHPHGTVLDVTSPRPFYFADRAVFDAWLLDQARAAGASFRQDEATAVDAETGEVTLAQGGRVRCGLIIGAAGATSRLHRLVPLDREAFRRERGLGVESYVPKAAVNATMHPDLRGDKPVLYVGFVRGGYGWVFPHREVVSVGVCGLSREAAGDPGHFKRAYARLCAYLGLDPKSPGYPAKAHPLPYGNYLRRPARDRLLLAGDAGALVEPLFGEGIFFALRSGQLAAHAALAELGGGVRAVDRYTRLLADYVLPELDGSLALRRLIFALLGDGERGNLALAALLRPMARPLGEMVHGVRSYKWLKRLPADHHVRVE